MPSAPRVLAVCVNWNGEEVLPDTLASLAEVRYTPFDLLVVDNASTDGSLRLIPPSLPRLQMKSNLGYGAALNRGISTSLKPTFRDGREESPPDYFLLLNNDVRLEPETVSLLVGFAERQGPGLFGPKLLLQRAPERLDLAWGRITWSHVLSRFRGKGRRDGPFWNRTRRVDLISGCVLLVHRTVFQTIGLFDETFFMYHEEVDLMQRARASGFPIYYCPFARAFHLGGHGSRREPLRPVFWLRRNTVYFFRKHRARPRHWLLWGITLLGSLGYNLLRLRWQRFRAILRGVAAGFSQAGLERGEAPGEAATDLGGAADR